MPLSRFRPRTREQALTLWSFVASVLCILAAWLGGGYAAAPNDSNSPSFYVIKHLLPGGVRTHGIILLILAVGMFYVIVTPFDKRTSWVLRLFAFYAFLLACSYVGSWIITKQIIWGAPAMWLGFGALAEGLVILPPDSLPEEGTDASVDHSGSGRELGLPFRSQDGAHHRRERGAGGFDPGHALASGAHPARGSAATHRRPRGAATAGASRAGC